jgi:hypothetical protein
MALKLADLDFADHHNRITDDRVGKRDVAVEAFRVSVRGCGVSVDLSGSSNECREKRHGK